MQEKEGWELNKHPKDEFINLCVDCAICNREEFFIAIRENKRTVVCCQHGNPMNPLDFYVVKLP